MKTLRPPPPVGGLVRWLVRSVAVLASSLACNSVGAHPSCDVARSLPYLSLKYGRVIVAKPSLVRTSIGDGIEEGRIDFTVRRYKRWPKAELRLDHLVVSYQYEKSGECDWRPYFRNSIYVFGRQADGSLFVVSAF